MLLERAVAQLGFKSLVAEDGEAAWELFREHDPEVIISDWMMPHMSGPDLVLELKHSESEISGIPVILLTDKQESTGLLILLNIVSHRSMLLLRYRSCIFYMRAGIDASPGSS